MGAEFLVRAMLAKQRMETFTQNNQETLANARKEAIAAEVDKGVHRLKKGVTRFVGQNKRAVGGVTLGAVGLLATSRLVRRRRRGARLLPRIAASIVAAKLPLRKTFRSYRKRAGRSPAFSKGALMGAGALIGTGLAVLLAPRWFAAK
jgi:hypothetical protein